MTSLFRFPGFDIPPWSDQDFAWIEKQVRRVADLQSRSRGLSPRFEQACGELREAAINSGAIGVQARIKKAIDVRACLYLWLNEVGFCEDCKPSEAVFRKFTDVRPKLSGLSFSTLLSLYFLKFDEVFSGARLAFVKEFIRQQFSLRVARGQGGIASIAEHQAALFADDPILESVNKVYSAGGNLETLLINLGLSAWRDGRFVQLCRIAFYIRQLESMPVGEDDPLLLEVSRKEVVNASFQRGLNLGHRILQILIDRSISDGANELSDAWRETILRIAGDPRLPSATSSYQAWWEPLGKARVQAMRAWMSRLDVGLFLQVLEEVGKQSDNRELQRMFPARHRLLSAVLETGRVINTKLFLSGEARRFVKREYPERDIELFGSCKDRDKSIIYMQVGRLHLIEGTHSFKLWIYPQPPPSAVLFEPSKRMVSPYTLGVNLGRDYAALHKGAHDYFSETHHTNLAWIDKAIAFMRQHGIKVDETDVANALSGAPKRDARHVAAAAANRSRPARPRYWSEEVQPRVDPDEDLALVLESEWESDSPAEERAEALADEWESNLPDKSLESSLISALERHHIEEGNDAPLSAFKLSRRVRGDRETVRSTLQNNPKIFERTKDGYWRLRK